MVRRLVWWSLLLAVLGCGGTGAWYFYVRPLPVTVAKPTRGPAIEAVYATGVVEPVAWSRVEPLTTGRLVGVAVSENEAVTRGQVLARLDDTEQQAHIAELEARLTFLRQDSERADTLARTRVATPLARDRARMELDAATAALAGARDRLKEFVIVAPLDGIVLRRDAEPGDIARPGTILFWIGRPSPLWAVVDVDEEDIPQVHPGQDVFLKADAFPARALPATVGEIRPKGDTVNKSYRVRLALPADTPLMIGMTVEANIVLQRRLNALLVPDSAVLGTKVMILKGNDTVQTIPVTVGVSGDGKTEIRTGIEDSTTVILSPPAKMQDGTRVQPENAPQN